MPFYFIAAALLMLIPVVAPGDALFSSGFVAMVTDERDAPSVVIEPYGVPLRAPVRIANDSPGVDVTARAAAVRDVASGVIMWSKNPDEVRPIASITKLMTLMVALDEGIDLDAPVTIDPDNYSPYGVSNFLSNDRTTVRDVFAAAVVASDNTAARVLAGETGLTADEFVRRMNQKAEELHLRDTLFTDPTGLSDNNVSTVGDVLLFADAAFQYPVIRDFAGRERYTITTERGTREIRSTNQLFGSLKGMAVGKTGFVTESGYNFVAQTETAGHAISAVVLGSETNADRFQDYAMIAQWIEENFTWND